MLIQGALYLDEEYVTRKMLTLLGDGDQAEEVLKRLSADEKAFHTVYQRNVARNMIRASGTIITYSRQSCQMNYIEKSFIINEPKKKI